MSRKSHLLTDLAVRHAGPGTHNDGNGLTLRVGANGKRSWVLRFTSAGSPGNLGLGSYPAVSLQEARALAADRRAEIAEGQRPTGARASAAARRPEPQEPTFRDVAERVIVLNQHHWTAANVATWRSTLANHVYPHFGDRPISEVGRVDILNALTPIWIDRPVMATRVRQRVNTIMAYALDFEMVATNPTPAAASKAFPQKHHQLEHFGSRHWSEMPEILRAVNDSPSDPITKLAFEWLVVTGVRKSEGVGARWEEFDMEGAIWTVPAGRMKMRREHRVPLSSRALEVLAEARALTGKDAGLVFVGRHRRELSKNTMNNLLDRAGLQDFTVHGIRSCLRVFAMEATSVSWAAGERALAHILGSQLVEAYTRSDLLDERRILMQAWSDYLTNARYDMIPASRV